MFTGNCCLPSLGPAIKGLCIWDKQKADMGLDVRIGFRYCFTVESIVTQERRPSHGHRHIHPNETSDIVLLGWGSTYCAMKEAVDQLNAKGLSSQMVHR
jgi:hypothetical protein